MHEVHDTILSPGERMVLFTFPPFVVFPPFVDRRYFPKMLSKNMTQAGWLAEASNGHAELHHHEHPVHQLNPMLGRG
jgi:hypothetical protein